MSALEAAAALTAALGVLVLLEQCERATGQPWVTDGDRERVKRATVRWEAAR